MKRIHKKGMALLLALLMVCSLLPMAAQAADYASGVTTSTTLNAGDTIASTIGTAGTNTTITVTGKVTVSDTCNIKGNVTIVGEGPSAELNITGASTGGLVTGANSSLTLRNVKVTATVAPDKGIIFIQKKQGAIGVLTVGDGVTISALTAADAAIYTATTGDAVNSSISSTARISGTVPADIVDNRVSVVDVWSPGGGVTEGGIEYAWGYGGSVTVGETAGSFTVTPYTADGITYVIDTVYVDGVTQTVTDPTVAFEVTEATSSVFASFAYTTGA